VRVLPARPRSVTHASLCSNARFGMPTLSDFVTFPDEFACRWHVLETVNKHWFLYDAMGMPDV
jgi:hypothetical protein